MFSVAAEYTAMPLEERMVPHVKTLFYHSKACSAAEMGTDGVVEESVNYLESYAKLPPQWVWGGNVLA